VEPQIAFSLILSKFVKTIFMEATAIDREMNSYFPLLREEEKASVVKMIKRFLQGRNDDGSVTIEQYNKEIEEAEAEIERGESFTHEQATEISKGWLNGR
jgi:hypothetical protein